MARFDHLADRLADRPVGDVHRSAVELALRTGPVTDDRTNDSCRVSAVLRDRRVVEVAEGPSLGGRRRAEGAVAPW